MQKYPENIMQDLRERKDLEPDDESQDAEIMARTSDENFHELCEWNGLLGSYSSQIKSWVEKIYGIDLDTLSINK
jgi:hypothetical protein